MPHCPKCQNELDENNKFCKKCGAKNEYFGGKIDSVVIPADETMGWDNNIPNPPSNPPQQQPPPQQTPPPPYPHRHQRSGAWYLLPIFFSWLGGLIAWAVIRDDDPKKAKNCLIIGIILTVVPIIIGIILIVVPIYRF